MLDDSDDHEEDEVVYCVSHKCGPLLSLSPFFALPLASLENAPIAMQWYTVRLCLRVKCFFSFCFKLGNTHHVMMRRKGRASVHLSLGASCQWEWRRQKGCRLSIDNLDNAKKRRSIQHHWGRNLSLQWSILTKSSQVRCGWQKLTCLLPYSCERYWGLHLDLHDTSQTSHRWTNGWRPSEIIAIDGRLKKRPSPQKNWPSFKSIFIKRKRCKQ